MHGRDVIAPGSIFLADGCIQVEYRVAAHDVESARHHMSLLGTLVGERCHMHLSGLHVKLQHQFFYVLVEIPHALLHLRLGECQLRFGFSHPTLSPSPIQYREGDGDACRLLTHRTAIGSADICSRLRKSKLHIEIRLQSGVGTSLRQPAFALLLDATVIIRIRTVQQSPIYSPLQRNLKGRHLFRHHQTDVLRLFQPQKRADGLHLLSQSHLGIHHVGLLVQSVDFQLQHLVFRNRSVLISPLRHLIKRIGRSKVLLCHFPFSLRRSQTEEMLTGLCRYYLQRFGISLLGFPEPDRFYPAIPLQGVIAKKTLLVAHDNGLTAIGGYLVMQLIQPVERTLHIKATTRQGDILVDFQSKIGTQLVLLQKECRTIRLGYLVHLLINIR